MELELLYERCIISMHDDLEPWAGICVGYNDDLNLTFNMWFRNHGGNGDPVNCWDKYVTLDRKGTELLCEKLNTKLTKLPSKCEIFFGTPDEVWSEREVFNTFDGITSYLDSLHITYQVKKIIDHSFDNA